VACSWLVVVADLRLSITHCGALNKTPRPAVSFSNNPGNSRSHDVTGAGAQSHYSITSVAAGSQFRNTTAYGFSMITADNNTL
jgi:hypothetical protein